VIGPEPRRGEIYEAELDPVEGHEQAGRRPLLIISIEAMNKSAAGLVIGMPMTTTDRGNPMHVRIEPTESGMTRIGFVMPEMVRSVSSGRLRRRVGFARPKTVDTAARRAGLLIGLGRSR
jgi:mRNA interferase MazF